MIKSILLLSFFVASISCASVYVNLASALIARSNLTGLQSTYSNLGFLALTPSAACSAAAYPTLPSTVNSVRLCVGNTVAYPYRSSAAGTGLEVALTAGWSALLTAQYGRAIAVSTVSVTITTKLFDDLRTALNNNQCDLILSSIFQNSDRDALLSASCPYATTGSGVLVGNKTAPGGTPITNTTGLNQAGVVIAIASGASSLTYVRATFPSATLILTTSTSESQTFATNGTANAAVGDLPVFSAASQASPTLCSGTQCTVFSLGNGNSNVVAYGQQNDANSTSATATPASSATIAPTSAPAGKTTTSGVSMIVVPVAMIFAAFALLL